MDCRVKRGNDGRGLGRGKERPVFGVTSLEHFSLDWNHFERSNFVFGAGAGSEMMRAS